MRDKGFQVSECKELLKCTTEIHRRTMGKMMWEEGWLDFAHCVGGSYSRQDAKGMWDEWATPTSGVLRCEDGPKHALLMLRVKVVTYTSDVNTVQLGKEFSVSCGVRRRRLRRKKPLVVPTRLAAWT